MLQSLGSQNVGHPTLCNPIDGSPLGSSVPGILQARILEWVAIAFSDVKEQGHTNCFLSLSALTSTPVSNHIDGQPLLIGKTEGERVSAPVLVMLLCWWEGWVCFLSASHSPWGMPIPTPALALQLSRPWH